MKTIKNKCLIFLVKMAPNLNVDLALKIMHEIKNINNNQERFNHMMKNHEMFTNSFPIIAKYMSLLLFNKGLFEEFLDIINKSRPRYEERYKFQAEYVRKLMIILGYNRMEAKKIYNIELEQAERNIRKIKKQERKIKNRNEKDNKRFFEESREEMMQFLDEIRKDN